MVSENTALILLLLLFVLLFYLHRRTMAGVDRMQLSLKESEERFASLQERLSCEQRGLFNQLESYLYLRDRLDLRKGLPYTRDWSAAPDFLKVIVEEALEKRPGVIFECSSGLTTLMLARCCQINGRGKVCSLESGEEYARATAAQVARYGLSAFASVLHAPLEEQTLPGGSYRWYALDEISEGTIDMLVIDGPPGFIQPHSRYPALPLLFEKLAENCVIFLDDAARIEEQELVEMWLQAYPELSHEYLDLERGCSVLKLNRG